MTTSNVESVLTDEDRDRIKDVVCEVLDVEPEEVTPDGLFTEQNDADSMSLVALSASLERAFDIEIEDDQLERLVSLDGVHAVIGDALSATR